MTPRIAALLSFYDESPLWLSATVASLAGVVDRVVAADGAYSLYPQARASSPVEQHQALVETAAACRIPLTLHVPTAPWKNNEVEKRNATIQLARAAGCTDGWWLLVVDADMVVTRASGGLYATLDATYEDVAEVSVAHHDDPHQNAEVERAAISGMWQTASSQPYRLLYRSSDSLRYEGSHYIVRNDHGFLWGNSSSQDLLPAADLTMELEFDHRSRLRDLERQTKQKAYYRVRDAVGAETLAVTA
jgi:hypothetical protein